MRYGPFVFLGLLLAMSLSWLGMIATPQLQIGNEQPTNVPPSNVIYPPAYPGMANLGQEIYRANGCAYCHTQVVRQNGVQFDVVVTNPGTNETELVQALAQLRAGLSAGDAQKALGSIPATVLTVQNKLVADRAQRALSGAGAEASVRVTPTGPDIQRGWGVRQTVGQDYLYAAPLMLGSARIGPDLANIGLRRPDAVWHLMHLYNPKLQIPGSIMPQYPFLFEKRARGRQASPDALPIPGEEQVIPTQEARALVAYLLSLRADLPLFEAPAPPVASVSSGTGDTNQPAAATAGTNAPAGAAGPDSSTPTQGAPK